MMLADLVPLLSDEQAIDDLAEQLDAGARLHVGPVPASARPALAAALSALRGPLLLIVSSPDAALRLHQDLATWLGPAALLFPARDAMPYEHMSADPTIVAQRLQVLSRLQALDPRSAEPLVIVAPIKAVLQQTLTPEELRESTLTLKAGTRHTPQELLARWSEQGYRQAPLVEQSGELSGRGGIVDVFPPTQQHPLRIEFWGDEIDSLRTFDAESQRSLLKLKAASVGPPHELPLWKRAEAIDRARALALDELRGEVLRIWEQQLARLEQGQRFEGRAFYAPLFWTADAPANLLAHLPPAAPVLFAELREIEVSAADLLRQADESRATQAAAGELPSDFPHPLWRWEALWELLGARAVLNLSAQDAEDEPPGVVISQAAQLRPWSLDLFGVPLSYGGKLRQLFEELAPLLARDERVVLVSPQAGRLRELALEHDLPLLQEDEGEIDAEEPPPTGTLVIRNATLSAGLRSEALRLTLLTDLEIFGWRARQTVPTKRRANQPELDRATFLQSLSAGDYVVHIEHGIGRFEGLTRLTVEGAEREYLLVRYAAGDALYVPIDQVDRLNRYIGAADEKPTLTRLGSADWERVKRRVKAAVQELADELLDLYAARQMVQGHVYSPDSAWQHELEESFPFVETEDQERALVEIKADMEGPRPMDRLICGDVGYGKTEVALRAAFKAVQDGLQVAVLVPTTILAQQHCETFSRRMAPFPVTVEMLSRFRTPSEQRKVLERLRQGQVDIVIGTHRILSKDVHFKQLGLVIVDEEQRFGVRHKELLKRLRREVDVLTLTATPIPRTLHMALAGIRDLSIINTPPQDRVPIKTYIQPYDEQVIREAFLRELGRGGQIYFVHNRVQSIYTVAARLQELVPEARFGIGHGQMDEKTLEKVMLDFFEGTFDVLVCTTIIESGLDVPGANTIIIDNAPHYGLAQLYQLRGRVGRSTQRGYAYLLYHPGREMNEDARRRLEAIQEATELGAGFRIAMRDLEIRGAGNLLGAEQSGHIAAVGFELYTRLLAQAVEQQREVRQAEEEAEKATDATRRREAQRRARVLAELARQPEAPVLTEPLVTLDLPMSAFLPDGYITDATVRLQVYQRLSGARTLREVRELREELRDRFGPPPPEAEGLLDLLHIKVQALQAGIASVTTTEDEITIRLPELSPVKRTELQRQIGAGVRIGPSFARLDRRTLGAGWMAALQDLLAVLARVRS